MSLHCFCGYRPAKPDLPEKLVGIADDNEAMSSLARYSMYFACYVALGLAVLTAHYYRVSDYNRQALDEQITLIAASHFSLSQLIDNLPRLFQENPHAAALKISDFKGDFLGAMYDSRRMSAAEYKRFLETKAYSADSSPVPGFFVHIWQSKGRKLNIIALSLPRMPISEYLVRMARTAYLHYLIPLFLLLGVFGLYALHLFSGKGLKRKRIAPTPTANTAAAARGNPWRLKPGLVTESAIRDTLQYLQQTTGASSASLFVRQGRERKSYDWVGVSEIHGALLVRGNALEMVELKSIADDATFAKTADGKTWLFFDGEFAAAQVCFVLHFAQKEHVIDEEMRRRIADFIHARAEMLMNEHYYENAILDNDTGLYSHPYAMFSLKERLLAGNRFATALMRFSGHDSRLDDRAARTAIRVLRERFDAASAPVIARCDDKSMLVIFAPAPEDSQAARQAVEQLFSAYRAQGKNPACALVEDAASCGSAPRVLKILELLLAQSEKTGTVAIAKEQVRLPVL